MQVPEENDRNEFRAARLADREYMALYFPQIKDDENNNFRIWMSRRSQALVVQIILINIIFGTNVGLTVYAFKQYGSSNGVGLIYEGDCETVRTLDLWVHLLINLLSTGMLSASNYCMQLQAAPTRADVSSAHGNDQYLDIGIPSLRNLRYISGWRRLAWALLAFSSIPIHLIYNSAVFQSLSSNDYTIAVVKDSFLEGSSWNLGTAEDNRRGDPAWDEARVNPTEFDYLNVIQGIQDDVVNHSYVERNISACFDLYNDYWTPQGNAVVLVANESVQVPSDDSLLTYVSTIPRSDNWAKNMWALGNGTGEFVAISPELPVTKWYLGPQRYEVSRCLVQPPDNIQVRCRWEYCPPIMFTICILNLIKSCVMMLIWFMRLWQSKLKQDSDKDVLYMLGDAVSSFMRRPETKTERMCFATKDDFIRSRTLKNRMVKPKLELDKAPRRWSKNGKRWMKSASWCRWFVLVFAILVVLVVAAILLGLGLASLRHRDIQTTIQGLWDLGFGTLTPYTYLVIGLPREDPAGLIANVMLANLPQLLLSFLYIVINAMLSTFLVQHEFSRMHKIRKPLRVSEPLGIQRSSYFISLPLRYGIPLYASSGFLHWLISQSLFLARITALRPDGTVDVENSFSTCGASPFAVIITLVVGATILVSVVLIGFRRYDGTMQMVATNSLAISAACHALEDDKANGYMMPVTWGVVEVKDGSDPLTSNETRAIGRCSVTTAADIRNPKEGMYYQ